MYEDCEIYKRFSIVYKLSWVGGSVHRVFFFFFWSGCFEVWLRIIFDLCFNILNLLCRKFSMNLIGVEIYIYFS